MNKIIILLLSLILTSIPKTPVKAAEPTVEPISSITVQPVSKEQIDATLANTNTLYSNNLTVVVDTTPKPEPKKELTLKERAKELVDAQFGPGHFTAFDFIIHKESTWNPNAVNKSSGACGLGQALPCSKMQDKSPEGQIMWVISYMKNRYGTPTNALSFWQAHHWY
jgi:hypothetical protein